MKRKGENHVKNNTNSRFWNSKL